MKQAKFRQYSALGQLGLWIIFFLTYSMDGLADIGLPGAFLYGLSIILCFMAAVYIHYLWILPFWIERKRWTYFFLATLLLSFFSILSNLVDYFFYFDHPWESLWWPPFLYNTLLLVLLLAVSSLYYLIEAWNQQTKTENLLRTEKLQTELNFLKSQINPHFLFNTLNNIYAYAQTGNAKTAPMLERLSSILRFMVYDCSEERVALTKELNAVEDLLEIHKMKNSGQRNIQLLTAGVKGYHLIAPLIIVNLVENAFKHSDAVSNPRGFINIDIAVDSENNCNLKVANSVKKKAENNLEIGGIGLENIKKRLDLQYASSYALNEERGPDKYYLKLHIPLERKQ